MRRHQKARITTYPWVVMLSDNDIIVFYDILKKKIIAIPQSKMLESYIIKRLVEDEFVFPNNILITPIIPNIRKDIRQFRVSKINIILPSSTDAITSEYTKGEYHIPFICESSFTIKRIESCEVDESTIETLNKLIKRWKVQNVMIHFETLESHIEKSLRNLLKRIYCPTRKISLSVDYYTFIETNNIKRLMEKHMIINITTILELEEGNRIKTLVELLEKYDTLRLIIYIKETHQQSMEAIKNIITNLRPFKNRVLILPMHKTNIDGLYTNIILSNMEQIIWFPPLDMFKYIYQTNCAQCLDGELTICLRGRKDFLISGCKYMLLRDITYSELSRKTLISIANYWKNKLPCSSCPFRIICWMCRFYVYETFKSKCPLKESLTKIFTSFGEYPPR